MPDLTTLEGEHEQIANLEIAVAHRTVIGQAIGILHERFGMDSEHASAVLARLSWESNIKLHTWATLAEHGHIDLWLPPTHVWVRDLRVPQEQSAASLVRSSSRVTGGGAAAPKGYAEAQAAGPARAERRS